MDIAPPDLNQVLELYSRGLCLQSYQRAVALAPLRDWAGTAARLLAGRLGINVGAPRLAAWHHFHAWRKDPADTEAAYYYARLLLQRRGPLPAWKFMRRLGELPDALPAVRADWLAFHGCVAGILRDFEAAESWLTQADQVSPDRPWICLERSTLFEMEDRYDEALASARRALELQPWYRPAVQSVAHVLQLLGRETEALDLLTEASTRIENGPVMAQLAAWQTELGRHADAAKSYDRYAELSPLMEKDVAEWLAARRCDTAYYLGDLARAAEFAKQAGTPFYQKLAERLADPAAASRRVVLPVGFVRQHHQTCAPATLSAISRFWQMAGDHLGVAEAICYDGTPNHNERQWVEQHGWRAREFTITWDSAVALIDRGVPFTLTTVEPASAHLQAVIGYDSRRQSLIIRDPYERHFVEFIADITFERYRSTGPRGMAMVPQDKAHLLDNLELPDESLYDHFYRMQLALKEHDRARAEECCAALATAAPEHRLTVLARRYLAGYDADPAGALASTEQMLKLYPDDVLAQLSKLSCLRELGRREERIELLRQMCAKPESDPICWQQYAQELSNDAREHVRVGHLLRRSMRHRPTLAGIYASLANLRWDQRRFDEALELYRLAACLDDKDEGLARSYFIASRHLRQTPAALQMLQHRFQRFGPRSNYPARTLYWAHNQLEQTPQAFEVLEAALKLPSADGDLRLFAAEMCSSYGKTERAAELLELARGQTQHAYWLRTAAGLETQRGDLPAALSLWREVLEAEPLAVDAHRAVVRLLAETDSRAAALEHLRQTCERFPHHFGLHQIWVEWLREEGPAACEPVVRKVVQVHPVDAWARRELALVLAEQHRFDAAYDQLEVARRLEPGNISHFLVRGRVCALAGRKAETKKAYREAIRISADSELAIAELVACCDTFTERREELAFIESELVRQVLFGDGLLAYREHAQYTLEPDELFGLLKRALEARPDLWHAWSAVIRQLTSMDRLDEAHELAWQATTRFPLLPRIWLDLALICQRQDDRAGERNALQHALEMNPGWGAAVRQLASLHEREGQSDEARKVLEQAVARVPLDASNHAYLAEVLWQLGEREAALDRVRQALRLEPGIERAWSDLQEWSRAVNRPEIAPDFARELTTHRAGEARSWLWLARTLYRPEDLDERLRALNSALALNPRFSDAYDMKAELLAEAERFEQALDACRPAAYDGRLPLYLRGRAAWIEARRGDRAEAIHQMRELVEEDPSYYWGWERLTEWYRLDGPPDAYLEASRVLVRLAPTNPTAFAYSGDAKLRVGDRAGAKEDFRRAMHLAPDFRFAGFHLFDEQLADNELDAAAETLEILKRNGGAEFALFREAQLALRRNDREAALAAVDNALAMAPTYAEAYDLKAEVLAEAGRYDEALAACRAEVWEDKVPGFLRGRAAWVEAHRGNLPEAVRQMRELLQEDPDYYWGWERLADWYRRLNDHAGYREAGEQLVRLTPRNPTAYGYRGEARLRTGDRAGAKEDFRQAMELAPDYRFAGLALFDEQLADNELDDAAQTLEFLKQHGGGEPALLREAQLALRQEDPEAALVALDAALEINPQFGDASDLKAETLARMERYDEALATCHPPGSEGPPLFLRGRAAWVEAQRGDLDVAIEQMRELVDQDPDYNWGWWRLAEWCRRTRDNSGYLEAAQALMRLAPGDPTAFGYSGEAKLRLGDRAGGKEDLRRALEMAPDYRFAGFTLLDEQLADNELDAAAKTIEGLEQHAGGADVLYRKAQLAQRRKELDAALTAVDAALAIDPHHGESCDLKAELLATAKRYDEALIACQPMDWDGELPIFLRGRAAWVEAERGNTDAAILQMRELVVLDPDYNWGWGRLADWCRKEEDNEGYLEAAQALIRLSPSNPVGYAYSGEAKQRLEDRTGAKEDYLRAHELAPDYNFVSYRLFDLQLEDGELDAAAETLEQLQSHADGDSVPTRAIKLAVKRGDRTAAAEALRELCEDEYADSSVIDEMIQLMKGAGWDAEVDGVLDLALDGPAPNPQVGKIWVERETAAGNGPACADRIEELLPEAVGKKALSTYVGELGKVKDQARLQETLARFREPLRADTWCWGCVGDALERVRDFPAAAEWMADWPERTDAEPWMLINLVLVLRGLERNADACRVSEHALSLEEDYTTPFHVIWLAADEALAGETDKAAGRLAEVPAEKPDAYHRLLRLWTEALLEVRQAGGGPAALAAVQRCGGAVAAMPAVRHDPALLLTHQRFVRQIGLECGPAAEPLALLPAAAAETGG